MITKILPNLILLRLSIAILVYILMTLVMISVSQAAEITVCPTGCNYTSIQAALNAASDGDIIIIGPGVYTQGIIGTGKRLTLQGAGANSTIINGTSTFNTVTILSSGVVTITDVTIQNGRNAFGGGIMNEGYLVLVNAVVRDNVATQHGGGIWSNGGSTLIIKNSTIEDNVSSFFGGGIISYGTAIINNSTIKNNRSNALTGGGIMASGSTPFILSNSTISGNKGVVGGGIRVDNNSTILLSNTTISNNTATSQGGGISIGGTAILTNTIIAGNITSGSSPDCNGTLTSGGYNLIQNTSDCTITGNFTGNITGQIPVLGPLQDNGGATQTHALQLGSPAIDAGSCSITTVDQRGFSRPVDLVAIANIDNGCDIGSYEVGPHLKLTKTVTPSIVYPNDTITYTIVIYNEGSMNATNASVFDVLPTSLNFIGPISLAPLQEGTIGNSDTLPILATDLNMTSGEIVTITFPVIVNADLLGGQVITGVATMTSAEVTGIRGEALITVANNPSITITKVANVKMANVDETITYTYRVTNTGNVELTNLIANDLPLGSISLNKKNLSPGQETTGVLTYTVVADDFPGPLTSTAVITSTFDTDTVTATTNISVALLENNSDGQTHLYIPLIVKNN